MGSCFVEHIGRIMAENKFPVDLNPFGTLYNPASVAKGLWRLMRGDPFGDEDVFLHEEVYHSFSHHSRFSSPSKAECLERINSRLLQSSALLREATRMIITWGTAWVYRWDEDGSVVSNCHKLPERFFQRERLSVDAIVSEWKDLLKALWEVNPTVRILFTVSPIRHWKDGAHGNQLSKATLLLAVEALRGTFPERIDYFPSFELMMDELRDYRFYADDMLHPSAQAIEYIWECFVAHYFDKDSQALLKEWENVRMALQHRPFQPQSEAYRQFILQTLLKMERIREKIPSFDFSNEMASLTSRLDYWNKQEDGVFD